MTRGPDPRQAIRYPFALIGAAREFGLSRARITIVAAASATVLAAEAAAVATLLPIMQFMERRGDRQALREASDAWELVLAFGERHGLAIGLGHLVAVSLAALFLRQAVTYFRIVNLAHVRQEIVQVLRARMFGSYLSARLETQDSIGKGEFANALAIEARTSMLAMTLPLELLATAAMLLAYVGAMSAFSPAMTAAVIAVLGVTALCLRGLMDRAAQASRDAADANRSMMQYLAQRLHAPRLVRLTRAERREAKEAALLFGAQRASAMRSAVVAARAEIVIEPAIVAIGFALMWTAHEVFAMSLADISVFLFVLLRLMPLAKAVVTLRQSILAASGSFESVLRLLARLESGRERDEGRRNFTGLRSCMRFESIAYSYPGASTPALRGIDLDVPRGAFVALVGPSGGGKSTLVDMIPRLREPDAGRLVLDGVPCGEFTLTSLRRAVAYAAQAPQAFDVPVAEHIRYANPDAGMDEVRAAALAAGAADFIERLPLGYDTPLGEAASTLSGGQRQRLELARALACQGTILVLDEPTSNLDNEAAAHFRHTIERLREGGEITILMIAHRLRTVEGADIVVVVEDGRVTATGSHTELLARSPWYRDAHAREISRTPKASGPLTDPYCPEKATA